MVAIVGSVDETRTFDPPLTDAAVAREACAELGRELAAAGWDLVVYSADETFVEGDVVRGFVDAGPPDGSVHVHAPIGTEAFSKFRDRRELFNPVPDLSRDWEVSFYRSLASSDGVLLVGGGRSTLIAGLIALAWRVPVVAVAAFGGNARKVWDRISNESEYADKDGVADMVREWGEGSARRLVRGLEGQRQARLSAERDDKPSAEIVFRWKVPEQRAQAFFNDVGRIAERIAGTAAYASTAVGAPDVRHRVRLCQPVFGPSANLWQLRIAMPTFAAVGKVLDELGAEDGSTDEANLWWELMDLGNTVEGTADDRIEAVDVHAPLYRVWSFAAETEPAGESSPVERSRAESGSGAQ